MFVDERAFKSRDMIDQPGSGRKWLECDINVRKKERPEFGQFPSLVNCYLRTSTAL
jgi:hypothetical protein